MTCAAEVRIPLTIDLEERLLRWVSRLPADTTIDRRPNSITTWCELVLDPHGEGAPAEPERVVPCAVFELRLPNGEAHLAAKRAMKQLFGPIASWAAI
jgi:hypothetical protein